MGDHVTLWAIASDGLEEDGEDNYRRLNVRQWNDKITAYIEDWDDAVIWSGDVARLTWTSEKIVVECDNGEVKELMV